MKMAIKFADVSNPTKIPFIAQEWTSRINDEFYNKVKLKLNIKKKLKLKNLLIKILKNKNESIKILVAGDKRSLVEPPIPGKLNSRNFVSNLLWN